MARGLRTAQVGLAALVAAWHPACNTSTGGSPEPTSLAISALDTSQQAKITAADGAEFDQLGIAVAVSGNTALVAADRDDDRGSDAGAVYVFVRSGTTWTQEAKLTAADGAANEDFGASVALSGDTAVIGAIFDAGDGGSALGAAFVFVRSGTTWTQQAKLVASDGFTNDQFGAAVAVSGDTAVVGAVNDSDAGSESGSAYVFVRSGGVWTQQAKLTAGDAAAADHFGTAVAVSGDTALIGASRDDDAGGESGSAYVFVRSGAAWSQQAKLTAADAAADDRFGAAVALSGDTALIGALFNDELAGNAGAAYVFVRSGTAWSQEAKLTATDSAAVDLFGVSVGVSGDTFVIGAFGDDDHGSSSGAAYVFAPPPVGGSNGAACTANAQCGSGFCIDGVCCDSACGGGDPGDCQACSIAAGAVTDGTCGPRAAGFVCRAAAGACDVAETCTGTSVACPADGFASAVTTCRAAAGACDVAERCTGSSAACPADGLASSATVCRTAAGACDVAERCTGASAACPGDGFAAGGTVCRAASNSCDLRETCTGSSAACPGDERRPDLSLCSGLLGLPGVCLLGICVL